MKHKLFFYLLSSFALITSNTPQLLCNSEVVQKDSELLKDFLQIVSTLEEHTEIAAESINAIGLIFNIERGDSYNSAVWQEAIVSVIRLLKSIGTSTNSDELIDTLCVTLKQLHKYCNADDGITGNISFEFNSPSPSNSNADNEYDFQDEEYNFA